MWEESLSSIHRCSVNSSSEQREFLLDLFSHVKNYETQTGRNVLPALQPVYQSAPAVWIINLSERKSFLFLEVLKFQTVKKPVELWGWPDEESEVKSFLQCLPYISQLSRQALLNIGFTCNNGVLNHLELPREISAVPWATQPTPPTEHSRRRRAERKQKRGKRGGLRAKLRLSPHRSAVPSLFLANVRALAGKMDELRLWTTTQRWIRECNIMIVTESWLNSDIPDTAVELDGRSMFRADRVAEDSESKEGDDMILSATGDSSNAEAPVSDPGDSANSLSSHRPTETRPEGEEWPRPVKINVLRGQVTEHA
ncbi:hypothetical protein SRHO_G00248910 [Serrasalmus rhombeus]